MKKKNKPIQKKEEIRDHPDHKIDEDFKGYPHGPANDETINPRTKEQEQAAGFDKTELEKRYYRKDESDEQDSDGSANAFEGK